MVQPRSNDHAAGRRRGYHSPRLPELHGPQPPTPSTAAAAAAAFLLVAGDAPLAATLDEIGVLVGWRLWATLLRGAAEVVVAMLLGSFIYERL